MLNIHSFWRRHRYHLGLAAGYNDLAALLNQKVIVVIWPADAVGERQNHFICYLGYTKR